MNLGQPKNTRREARTIVGRFRGGKLAPVMAVDVRGNEGGMLSQTITMELDPVAGRLLTPVFGELVAVFVPLQAIDAIRNPAAAYAGMTEVVREKLLSGNPLFGLEAEGEISKRCGVNPRKISGVAKVNEAVRLAHNAAVNALRLRRYHLAVQVLHGNTAITPAVLSETVLDRLNGVLDPDDRINGAVELSLPTINLPVVTGGNSKAGARLDMSPARVNVAVTDGGSMLDANTLFAKLNGGPAGSLSLIDFFNAQNIDRIVRQMGEIVEANPQYGQEMVLRWVHGLTVDSGRVPFVLAERREMFGRAMIGATDSSGVLDDVKRSDMAMQLSFNVPVPKTELGGIIITFACVKPDEVLADQPHPTLSDVWGLENYAADELALDPVPVTMRELNAGVAVGDENTIAFYTGKNALRQAYVAYGLSRHLNPATVEHRTAIWQLAIPASVTPSNILYPADLPHYPFPDQNAEVCTYTMASQAVIRTPMILGPTPVETLPIIDTENLFEE